ncbi:hypothetical protein [Microcoleus sp. bin38.metabat.b11b12b14.051]|uniref:hypothetical protein n=1 Tax=Microcoleus sp. bin38.metabat.b11b12b14.051 TaxID=2742709 RepID=UPI0025E9E3EF|nr:hypothetical protein [Microcoleus sp. bin38.metabat.b11b12b14.051]
MTQNSILNVILNLFYVRLTFILRIRSIVAGAIARVEILERQLGMRLAVQARNPYLNNPCIRNLK